MFKSIRWNFLSWLTLILLLVIGGYGSTLFYLLRLSKLKEIDAELEGAAQVLAAKLRGPGPRPARGPGGPKAFGRGNEPLPMEPIFPEEFLAEYDIDQDGRLSREERGFAREERGKDRLPRFPRGMQRLHQRGMEHFADQIEIPETFLRRFGKDQIPYFVIWRAGGRMIKESNLPADLTRETIREYKLESNQASLTRQRGTSREIILRGPRETRVLVGRSIDRELADLRSLVGILSGTGLGVLLLGLAGAWFLSKRAIKPIQVISSTAASISASNLSQRIDIKSTKNELGNLAKVLNTTFDRLQEAFEQQARFTSDASHELRTPVSVILAQTAMARRRERSARENREVIDACYNVASRMRTLVEGLLTLARSDAGNFSLKISTFDLKTIAEECSEMLKSLAADRGISIQADLESAEMEGDPGRMAQVVTNLLTNAIQYNREGGKVNISLRGSSSEAVLVVSDTGIGISREDIPRIFNRFYRVDPSRSGKSGGTGLGLAISWAILNAHGGTITCKSEQGEGTSFTVRLPKAGGGALQANALQGLPEKTPASGKSSAS